jgi:hypothetical protein
MAIQASTTHVVSFLHILSGPKTSQSEHVDALPAKMQKFTLTFHPHHLSFPFLSAVFPTFLWTLWVPSHLHHDAPTFSPWWTEPHRGQEYFHCPQPRPQHVLKHSTLLGSAALAFLTPLPLTVALNSPLPFDLNSPHFCTFLTSRQQPSIHSPIAEWNSSIVDSRTPCEHVALHPIGLLTCLGVSWLSVPSLMSCPISHQQRLFLAHRWYCPESFQPLQRMTLLIFSPA